MPEFIVELYELHAQKYKINAANKADAISKVLEGEAEPMVFGLDFVENGDQYGQPVEELLEDESPEVITKFCEENDLGLKDRVWGVRSVEES